MLTTCMCDLVHDFALLPVSEGLISAQPVITTIFVLFFFPQVLDMILQQISLMRILHAKNSST